MDHSDHYPALLLLLAAGAGAGCGCLMVAVGCNNGCGNSCC
ncbi:MAG: hypothetical protein ACLRWQ_12985 [Flavonifractor plautii]